MRIEAISLENFPPFADAILEFPPLPDMSETGEVQLLTGENGTGKTRLLCLIAAACGNTADLDSRMAKSGQTKAFVLARLNNRQCVWESDPGGCAKLNGVFNTEFIFDECRKDGFKVISDNTSAKASLVEMTAGEAPCSALAFRGTVRVSDSKIVAMQPVEIGSAKDHVSFDPVKDEDSLVCQIMANLKMGAAMEHMNKIPTKQSRSSKIVERLESAITNVTGREFSFDVTPHPELRLRVFWGGVAMRLVELPDGLRSIIGWLVSCIAKLSSQFPEHPDPLDVPLILLLDEPESHLHPAWQRKLLPAAQALLPHAQMFVATHSPFVISSVNSGWIHVLRADKSGLVTADKPRPCSEGDSYLDVVEDILGVKEWYDPETEQLLAEFRTLRERVIEGKGSFEELRSKAEAIGHRSDSLRELMAREMKQADRLVAQGVAGA